MQAFERRQVIVELLQKSGILRMEDLAQAVGSSVEVLDEDLKMLERQGAVLWFPGSALAWRADRAAEVADAWQAFFQTLVSPGENLVAVVGSLSLHMGSVADITPDYNSGAALDGALGLTYRRLIAVWRIDSGYYKCLYIPAVSSLTERPPRPSDAKWPYQAIVITPGRLAIVAQPKFAVNDDQWQQLSTLLLQALFLLGPQHRQDNSATPGIADSSESKEDG